MFFHWAMQAGQVEKNESLAWACLSKANFWLGVLMGKGSKMRQESWDKSIAALRGHRRNHTDRDRATDYYEKNRTTFRSRSSAAKHIAGKVVHKEFRTVYRWLGDHDRNKKST